MAISIAMLNFQRVIHPKYGLQKAAAIPNFPASDQLPVIASNGAFLAPFVGSGRWLGCGGISWFTTRVLLGFTMLQ